MSPLCVKSAAAGHEAEIQEASMSTDEQQALPKRAFTVSEFCRYYRLGRTSFYQQVRLGHLRVRKIGTRSLVATEDAESWFQRLSAEQVASTPALTQTAKRGR